MPTQKFQQSLSDQDKNQLPHNCPGLLWSQSTGSNENPNLRTNRLSKSVQRPQILHRCRRRKLDRSNRPPQHPPFAAGTALHSWQAVAQGKSSIAHKGMLYAAKIMALTALDFYKIQNWQIKPEKELTETLNGETYPDPLPKDLKPEYGKVTLCQFPARSHLSLCNSNKHCNYP